MSNLYRGSSIDAS